MDKRGNRQNIFWGGLMIIFGIMGFVQVYTNINVWIWVVVLGACGLGTYGLYAANRSDKALLFEAYAILATTGLVALIELYIMVDSLIAMYVLGAIAVPFLFIYLRDRSQWWALIPAYVLIAVAFMVPLIDYRILVDEFIAGYVLTAIAVPFIVVFLRDRSRWWALIPAYVLIAIGLMVALIGTRIITDVSIAAYVMFAIALPFFVVYARDRSNWWALIPGGITGVIGLGLSLAGSGSQYIIPGVLIIAGGWILFRQLIRN